MLDNYEVTEDGRVIAKGTGNSNNSKPKELAPFKCGKGRKYLKVRLYLNSKYKDFAVHRLVAEAFIPNPNNLPHVNHKDENTFNNHKDNLEWCDPQYNKEYSSSKHFKFKSPSGEVVEVFNLSKFCRENNLSNGSLYQVIKGNYKQHKGWSLP